MKRLAVVTATLLLAGSCSPKAPQVKFKYAEKRATLNNGLKLVVIPDKASPLVHVHVRYDVGATEDPAGKSGIAHFVEHIMFQHRMLGPDKPPTFDLLPQFTLYYNAFTGFDQTHYFLVGSNEDLETLLKVEAFRMNALCETIPEAQFQREREVVRNEARQNYGTAEGLIPTILARELYPKGHAYSHIPIGDDQQLASITFQDVCSFMSKYYTPERATLIVAGNVDPDQVGRMVNGIFGGIPKRQAAPRASVTEVPLKYRRVDHELDLERPRIYVGWRLPRRDSKDWPKARALFGLIGKLAQQADEWEFATEVGVQIMGGMRAPTFLLALELPPGGDIDEALDYVWRATKTAHWGLKNMDFDREAKAFLKMSFIEGLESLDSRALSIAEEIQLGDGSIAFDSTKEYGMKEYFEIDKLSADGYSEFVKKTLDRDKATVIVFKPSKNAKKAYHRADLTFSANSHEQRPQPIVDPAEAKRPLPSPKSPSILSKAERYTLGNGMRVILLPTEGGLPLIHAEVVFDVGAAHEPPNQAGLASVAASYLRPPKDATFMAFASFGGDADYDNTQFVGRGLNIYTDVVIKGLERLIKIGEYDQESIERYQKRVKDRYKSAKFRRELVFGQAPDGALYGPNHPYVVTGTPTPDSVDNIGYDAATAWKREHYTAKNATLIVVGNYDVKQVKKLIADNFGEWNGGRKDQTIGATAAQRSGPVHVGVVGDAEPQMAVTIAYPSPAGVDSQYAARLVLAAMLNDQMALIRTELGSTYGTYAGRSRNVGPNAYQMGGTVDGARAGESLKAMRDKVDALRRGEDFDRIFAIARRTVLKRLLTDSNQTASLASRLAGIAVFDLGPDYYDTLAKYVAAASPAQVKALIQAELDPKNEVLACMADRKTLEKAFKEAGLTSVKYVEPK
jgi:zinc protease